MDILLWFLYAVGILLTWFESRWIVGAWPSDRPIWFSPVNQGVFWIVRLALCYGVLAGLWFYEGLITAVVAFIAYYIFHKIAFHIYFTREIRMTAQRYAALDKEEARSRNEEIDEAAIMQKAFEIAKITVVQNMKGGAL